jgi:hypothetical protein
MHKNATKYNKTQSKWCINKHGASKIIDTFETYQGHGHNLRNTVHTSTVTRFNSNESFRRRALGHYDNSQTTPNKPKNLHVHDSLTQISFPVDNKTPGTTAGHHLSPSTIIHHNHLSNDISLYLLRVAPPNIDRLLPC